MIILFYLLCGIIALVTTTYVLGKLIPFLREKKIRQLIIEVGPTWHKGKAGTPTMGGISFIIAMTFVTVLALIPMIFAGKPAAYRPMLFAFGLALGNGLIGMIDDLAKVRHKANLGLHSYQKFGLQMIVAGAYVLLRHFFYPMKTVFTVPFSNMSVDLGIFYEIIVFIIILFMVNAVNLTDGLDGLASSNMLIVGCAFLIIGAFLRYSEALSVLSVSLIGGMIGFLGFNFHPAKIFMGDTGSLFLGGLLCGMGLIVNQPLLILIMGGVFAFEALSVVLQVVSFKLRSKRIFLCTPAHHHYERKGFSEEKIVYIFTTASLLLCLFGIAVFYYTLS